MNTFSVEQGNGVFHKWNRNSGNLWNLINHWRINWNQLKDSVSYMFLAGTVLALWLLTQEVACLIPFTVMTNIFITEFPEFSENIQGRFQHGWWPLIITWWSNDMHDLVIKCHSLLQLYLLRKWEMVHVFGSIGRKWKCTGKRFEIASYDK